MNVGKRIFRGLFGRRKPHSPAPPPLDVEQIVDVAKAQDRDDILHEVLTEQTEIAGAMRPDFRRARHAFAGARAYLLDLQRSHFPLATALHSATSLDPQAIRLEAAAMVERMRRAGELDIGNRTKVMLAEQIATFVCVAFYAGWLYNSTFTDEWLLAHEQMLNDRLPPPPEPTPPINPPEN